MKTFDKLIAEDIDKLPIMYSNLLEKGEMTNNGIVIRKVSSEYYHTQSKTVILINKPISKIYKFNHLNEKE